MGRAIRLTAISTQTEERQAGGVREFPEPERARTRAQGMVGDPERAEGERSLDEQAAADITVNLVAKLVSEHRLDLVAGERTEQGVEEEMRRVRPSPTTAAFAVRLLRDWSATQTPSTGTSARAATRSTRERSSPWGSGVRR